MSDLGNYAECARCGGPMEYRAPPSNVTTWRDHRDHKLVTYAPWKCVRCGRYDPNPDTIPTPTEQAKGET